MVTINRIWWEYLAPKVMHRHLREFERQLQTWCQTPYGTLWLRSAKNPNGVIRSLPGQAIPVAHFIALADSPIFIVPQRMVREGHRSVETEGNLRSGHIPIEGEMVLTPSIMFDVVRDSALLAAVARRDTSAHIDGVKEPSVIFSVPAHLLIAPTTFPTKSYVLYQHIFGSGPSYPDDGFFYVGVTTRSWQKRWVEHKRAVATGSPLLFHRKLREELDAGRVTYIHHKVMGVTDDIENLYSTEEFLVQGHWHDSRRLNMIPGGKSGLKYLRENSMLPERVVPLPDERDRLVETWLREHPRKGLPAPWVSEKWKDDNWAVAQICGREDRLSAEQVRAIRQLATNGNSAAEISARIGARNKEQVQRVIDEETYTRVV